MKKGGFNREYDTGILETISGDHQENHLRDDLYNSYEIWLEISEVSHEERVREGYASPEECQKNVIREIEKEIRRLKRYRKARTSTETARMRLEVLRRSVPHTPALDRPLRYEAHPERIFDRTLQQLQRLQRMRKGQPVPPSIDVRLSAT